MQILSMGPLAVLVDELDDPAGWADAFRQHAPPGVVDVVPAAATVLVVTDDEATSARVRAVAERVDSRDRTTAPVPEVVIDVTYDGADLAHVARATRLSVDEVIEQHSGALYRVEFCGFAPGFAYLSGLPTQLHLPRRSTPRTRVPAGSVAIASWHTAVYPTASPGGWHLLGSTTATLFDVERNPPARLIPGTRVRFTPT